VIAICSTQHADALKSYDLCWLLHLVGDAVSVLFNSKLVCLDLSTGKLRLTSPLGEPAPDAVRPRSGDPSAPPNEGAQGRSLAEEENPLAVVWDARRSRIYASLWGTPYVAVLDATDGHLIARCPRTCARDLRAVQESPLFQIHTEVTQAHLSGGCHNKYGRQSNVKSAVT
jgi:hypothetical protein